MSKRFQSMKDIPLTPANYAIVEGYARAIQARGEKIPPHILEWGQQAQAKYGAMTPAEQHATLGQLEQFRQSAVQFQEATEKAVGYNEASRYFRDNTRGIGGDFEGADAKRLREIAENKTTVTEKRVAERNVMGATIADPYSRQTQYRTERKESRKYSDEDSRRASLVLAFAEHDGQRAVNGASMFGRSDGIDPAYRNSPHERTRDVAEAIEEVESRAGAGMSLPTDAYEPTQHEPSSFPSESDK